VDVYGDGFLYALCRLRETGGVNVCGVGVGEFEGGGIGRITGSGAVVAGEKLAGDLHHSTPALSSVVSSGANRSADPWIQPGKVAAFSNSRRKWRRLGSARARDFRLRRSANRRDDSDILFTITAVITTESSARLVSDLTTILLQTGGFTDLNVIFS
jgi:hypothetical protein